MKLTKREKNFLEDVEILRDLVAKKYGLKTNAYMTKEFKAILRLAKKRAKAGVILNWDPLDCG